MILDYRYTLFQEPWEPPKIGSLLVKNSSSPMCIGTWIVGCAFRNLAWLFSPKYIEPFSSNAPDRWCHEADNTSFRQLRLIKHIIQLEVQWPSTWLDPGKRWHEVTSWCYCFRHFVRTSRDPQVSACESCWTHGLIVLVHISLSMLCMYLDTICLAYSAQFSFSDISIALVSRRWMSRL